MYQCPEVVEWPPYPPGYASHGPFRLYERTDPHSYYSDPWPPGLQTKICDFKPGAPLNWEGPDPHQYDPEPWPPGIVDPDPIGYRAVEVGPEPHAFGEFLPPTPTKGEFLPPGPGCKNDERPPGPYFFGDVLSPT